VRIDPMHLGQVLVNLAVNARDAMPAGGTFRIEVAEQVDEAGRWVELTCTDSGTGMDAETVRRAFDPFFTTKDRGRGTGLGLATCHGIVCQAGGSIAVESFPGRGATFRVRLPRTEQPLDALDHGERPARPVRVRGETILVVEDDAQIRALVGTLLTTAGYRVGTAESPEAALELFARESLVPDLLLADVIMPGGNGKGLAETLRARNPAMAVLYMSGYTADVVGRRCVVESDGVLLRKPFTPDELLSRVDELLDARERVAARHDELLAP
jgi:CheY-like chemotaxis protein